MPEGDTIHKLANALAPTLIGRIAHRVELKHDDGRSLTARRITAVSARGKHLFIDFGGRVLRTHLGMYGSWHRYAADETWSRPAWQASVVLAVEDSILVCFNAKEVEVLRTDGVRDRALQLRLGVDLLAPDRDQSSIIERARNFLDAATPLADVLLDQRIACGIGNVYKSEVLFLQRLHPLAPLGQIDDDRLLDIYRTAADLLRRNLASGPRVTRLADDGAGALWVYRRSGLPCFECRSPVRYARLGRDWRPTYWCPHCQPGFRATAATSRLPQQPA